MYLIPQKEKPELKALSSKGVDVISVDYSSQQSIIDALKGTEVVLSTLRDDGLDIQANVIRAAKDAGVKLFVPSEYGRNTFGDTSECASTNESFSFFGTQADSNADLKVKVDAHDHLKQLNLPYALFFTGIWPEMMGKEYGPVFGIDFESGKFRLFGDGSL